MIVIGKHRVVEESNIEVEIDPKAVLQKIYWNALTGKPEKSAYISNGFWYVEDGYDYHRRDDIYSKDRPATDEELSIYNAYILLKESIQ